MKERPVPGQRPRGPRSNAPHAPEVIALDVGGSSVKSGRVTSGGHLLGPVHVTPVDSQADADTLLAAFVQAIRKAWDRPPPIHRLRGLALAFPGPFDYRTGISYIQGVAKYEALYGLDVGQALRERLGAPELDIRFRNDAEAALVGEARHGVGRPYGRVLGITLGTGCGSAFLVDGRPVTRGPGVPPQGWLYPVPFQGEPADAVFSTRGLVARLETAGIASADLPTVAAQARAGDPRLRRVFQGFGADLATFLAPFVAAFQAQAVLVMGGIARSFDLFGPALVAGLSVPVLEGRLGARAALLGAAALFLAP